jgi:hypothetical protein
MAVERNRPDEMSHLGYQLLLPWEPPLMAPPAPLRTPLVQPQQVWRGLAPTEQGQLQQAFVRVIREVLRDADSD